MGKNVEIVNYTESYIDTWDDFVLNKSCNGSILQTRRFLEYHPSGRFKDNSLMFFNGNTLVAVIPANITEDKKLCSHNGSTFGGIVLGDDFKNISYVEMIFDELESYLLNNQIAEVRFKMPGRIYTKKSVDLIDYYFFLYGYKSSCELGYYIDFEFYDHDITSNFTHSRRRGYKYSNKNDLSFAELTSVEDIEKFYFVLCDNYKKFDKIPVHSIEELMDLKFNRLKDCLKFYGVWHDNCLVAGSMVFCFEKKVFHTQYLAMLQDKAYLYASEYNYKNLIETALKEGFKKISFGTATLDGGRTLNKSLAQFKEGFGAQEYINQTYTKKL